MFMEAKSTLLFHVSQRELKTSHVPQRELKEFKSGFSPTTLGCP
jgi:hypothetical protein